MKKLSKLFAVLFALAILVTTVDRVPIEAAAKTTVRVNTQKQLNKALKNSGIDTIIFRSSIYDKITINSKKAKKKNIIIDAPYCSIENRSKFKSIEIQYASYYTEDVSGNTITLSGSCDGLLINDGITVKKLISTLTVPYYTVGKGASIKTVAFDHVGDKGIFDKKTRTITLNTKEFEEDESWDASFVYTLDKSGRILEILYTCEYAVPEKQLTKYVYDKDGNLTSIDCIDYETEDVIWNYKYKYDSDHNRTEINFNNVEKTTYKYDSNNCVTSRIYDNDTYHEETSYVYDSNLRNISMSSNGYYMTDGEKDEEKSVEYTYKYDKIGNHISTKYNFSDGTKGEIKNTYDKSGNKTYMKDTEIDPSTGETLVWESKMEYDEYGIRTGILSKTPYSDEWLDPTQYAG